MMSNEELLLAPRDIILYGRTIKGIELKQNDKEINFGHRIEELRKRKGKDESLKLANIYGFAYEGSYNLLPEPVVFLLVGEGKLCDADEFPAAQKDWKEYSKWRLEPDDPSVRFDIEAGSVEDLLLPFAGVDDDSDGGTLIRGADGRMYFIPDSLDAFEIHDEDEKSVLSLSESVDHPNLSVSTTAFRGRLAFRGRMAGRMAFRGRMAFKGRMAFRGRMTAPNRCR